MLRLRTLGGLSIERESGPVQPAAATSARRRLALLAVLAASESRGVPRERLLALFWPESDTARARHSLDQTIHALKRDGGGESLVLGREELTLNPAVVTSDIGDLRYSIAEGRHESAVALHVGPFLDGVHIAGLPDFERWVDDQRSRITREIEHAIEALAVEASRRGDHHAAALWWQRLAALDPRKTRVIVSLMTELAASGDRAGALRQAEVYRALVQDDLEVEPNPVVTALADRLRREPSPNVAYSPPAQATPVAAPDVTGGDAHVIAGRYVIEREVGRGGSAHVYLARDLRHERPVALKLLRPALAAGLGVERFRHEIAVTANLQHPHILPIHESGEAEGTLYLVMPYVEGESLRDRLTRERRLSVTDAVRLAREVGSALAYAHARGILHRDVKPENILLSSGHAIVADFGLALALGTSEGDRRTGPGIVLGTLAYLSPELARGTREADARSDQYCLASVLYESLAGTPTFRHDDPAQLLAMQASSTPPSLRTIRGDVPIALDRAIMRALEPDPEARFDSVSAFVAAVDVQTSAPESTQRTDSPPPRVSSSWKRITRRPRLLMGAVASLVIALTLGVWMPSRTPAITERAWIVLAGVENRTGDTLLDRALDAVVEAGLEQSAYVNLLPRSRVRGALALMRRDSSAVSFRTLDEALAREVAQREAAQAVVAGAIDKIDSVYVVSLRLVRARDGDVLSALTSVAKKRGAVIDAVDDLVRRMRRSIGESADVLSKRDRPLPYATTRSLAALRLYGDGLHAERLGDRNSALELWHRAIAIDSEFVSAHVQLGAAYYQGNLPPKGELHFAEALRFLDRATDREQLRVRATIEAHRGNRDGAIEIRRTLLASYPDDVRAWQQLGYEYMRAGREHEAVDALSEAIARDSTAANVFVNLANAQRGLGRYADAIASYHRAFAREPQLRRIRNVVTEYAAVLTLAGRVRDARAAFDTLLRGDLDQQAHGARSIGLLLMTEGRYGEAIGFLRQAVVLSTRPARDLTVARNRLFLAAAQREKGWSDSARAEVLATHAIFRRTYIDPEFLVHIGRALVGVGELPRAREVLDTLRQRLPASPNPVLMSDLQLLAGEIALSSGRTDSALTLLDAPRRQEPTVFSIDGPARALAVAGRAAEAASRYDSIAANPDLWIGREGQEVGVLALLRAGKAYEAAGDVRGARQRYERFLAGWPRADADLVSVREARSRLAAIAWK